MEQTYRLELVLTAADRGETVLPEKDGRTVDPLVLTTWP
jgi:hypothetical protein